MSPSEKESSRYRGFTRVNFQLNEPIFKSLAQKIIEI